MNLNFNQSINLISIDIKDEIEKLEQNADHLYSKLGFATVTYDIQVPDRIFGIGAYIRDEKIRKDNEALIIQDELINDIERRLNSFDLANKTIEDEEWHRISSDTRLLSSEKLRILRRWFKYIYIQLMKVEMPILIDAQEREKENICKFYPAPGAKFLSANCIDFKKKIYNSVVMDAFKDMGFEKMRTVRGFIVLRKKIYSNLEIIVDTDRIPLIQPAFEATAANDFELQYLQLTRFSGLSLDFYTYALASDSGVSRKLLTFSFSGSSHARHLCRRYIDSSTLEVALRAHACWYRSMVMPFEDRLVAAWKRRTHI